MRVSLLQDPGTETEKFTARRKSSSVEQIVAILRQADVGVPLADSIPEVGVPKQIFDRWEKQLLGPKLDTKVSSAERLHFQLRAQASCWINKHR